MRISGITAEYNPFHLGHLHHIRQCKQTVGEGSAVVCVMSGNFVQRGDTAVFCKHSRAEAAVLSGADLVFELPLPWALSSAEGFARGAVGLLGALGVVTHLNFGSECGDIGILSEIAAKLIQPGFDTRLLEVLHSEPITYAAARQLVLERELGDAAKLIEKPNNILAVEYLKSLYDQRLEIEPLTTLREGAGHDSTGVRGGMASASELRAVLAAGGDISRLVPDTACSVYERERRLGRGPVTMAELEPALLSRVRQAGGEIFSKVPGAVEGLDNRLSRAARFEPTLDAVLSAAKTKRYTLSRLRRMLMCACLGITAEMAVGTPPYARLLAANKTGCELLAEIRRSTRIPVITKPASIKELPREARELFALESAATDLYVLGYGAKQERRGGAEYTTSPVIVGASSCDAG